MVNLGFIKKMTIKSKKKKALKNKKEQKKSHDMWFPKMWHFDKCKLNRCIDDQL